ncbi:hypothetical protein [Sphingomonas bisphenolicum]|uniref:Lipoprotein n=1 Tax=Sphingomonas bisphenolicum TaxID=296544 RepID=A0ABN5W7V8_9SPHN|nr:hypothetical protein [Sphingomonas bisphenolicum]BBF68393.1 hypothetical protein SBA_ch1_05930 [Sphingomonas bisphenolicum]
MFSSLRLRLLLQLSPHIALRQIAARIPLVLMLAATACSSADQQALENIIRARAINPAKVEISEAIIYRDKNDARMACLMVTDYNQWGEALPTTRVNAWYIFKSQSWHFDNFWEIRDGLTCEKYVAADSKDGAGTGSQASSAEPTPMPMPPATNAPAPTIATTDQLIDGCYHLDSCTYSRALEVETVKEQGGDRLLRALIENGEVSDAAGSPDDLQRIRWSGASSTIYAFCSARSPAIIWSNGGPYMAEEFDFAGGGIPGAQQNNANIYQALCHGIYDNSLSDRAASLGYRPLAETGGRGQFIVASPEALFAGN